MTINKKNIKYIILTVLFVIFLLEGIYYMPFHTTENIMAGLFRLNIPQNYIVELKEGGFYPKEISILKGDTITFTTTQNEPFWPEPISIAPRGVFYSLLDKYPEFVAPKPINHNEQWSFLFERDGIWKYRDRLNTEYEGIIFVFNNKADLQNKKNIDSACVTSSQNQLSCLKELILETAKNKSSEEAFKVLDQIYSTKPEFRETCHSITHELGEIAYKKFTKTGEISSTIKTKYCDYGFFHGFMDAVVSNTEDLNLVYNFCTLFNAQRPRGEAIYSGCFNGFGHGMTDRRDHENMPHTEKEIIGPSLHVCEKIGETDREIEECGGGVFNALSRIYRYSSLLTLDKENPFRICDEQSKSYFKRSCYRLFKILLMNIENNNFIKAAHHVEQINDKEFANAAIYDLAVYATQQTLGQNADRSMAVDCQALQQHLRTQCIRGVAGGLISNGIPEKEYIRALRFCDMEILSKAEKQGCYDHVLWESSIKYKADMFEKIRTIIEKRISTLP